MTDEMMSLRTLLEKSSDAELLREMVGFAAQRLMELEVEGLTGAAHGERSPDRINHRNGYRDGVWETRAGAVELRKLQARILPPPPFAVGARVAGNADKLIPAAKDDWQGAVVAPPATDTEDPANAGIRREPELPEHEDIITKPRKPAQEFDLPDDEADDDAQRLRVLQRQVRATARQVSLDPADDMGL